MASSLTAAVRGVIAVVLVMLVLVLVPRGVVTAEVEAAAAVERGVAGLLRRDEGFSTSHDTDPSTLGRLLLLLLVPRSDELEEGAVTAVRGDDIFAFARLVESLWFIDTYAVGDVGLSAVGE